jgi:TPR repeat protein
MKNHLFPLLIFICCTALTLTFKSYATDYELGLYELNRGDFTAAIKEFEPLVELGYTPAQYQMGVIYQKGYGVPKNATKAIEFFELAAKRFYADALFELSLYYTEGRFIKKDLKKAYTLMNSAAIKHLPMAQFNVAVMYEQGAGTPIDYFKAARWYKAAANQNLSLAQYNLALLYSEGLGVEKSVEMSYIWNTLSAWNGYITAEKSRAIDKRNLTPVKIEIAEKEAHRLYLQILETEKVRVEKSKETSVY